MTLEKPRWAASTRPVRRCRPPRPDACLPPAAAADADGSLAAAARFADLPPGASDFPLLDLNAGVPPQPRWFVMDDTVMGGVSSSGLAYDPEEQAAVFSGARAREGPLTCDQCVTRRKRAPYCVRTAAS